MCAHRTRRFHASQGPHPQSTSTPSRALRWLATGLVGLALSASTNAQTLQTAAADWKALGETPQGLFGDGRLEVLRGDDEWLLSDGDGDQLALPWPSNAVPYDLERLGDFWWATATEAGERGLRPAIVAGQGDQARRLPAPTAGARVARDPVLLTDDHGLRAIVWLEGTSVRTLRPRAARWHGEGWDPAIDLAPVGPGTQIALTATVLADGSWLAAWAAYDGSDDEILWSRAVEGRWSAAQPLTQGNEAPDITPHLQATGDGALIAWSRFDGSTYRVQLSRFVGGAWTLPRTLGERGTSLPRFLPGDTPLLAYKHGHPRAWTVVELEPTGKPRRRAHTTTQQASHPRLQESSSDQLRLTWDPSRRGEPADTSRTLRWQEVADARDTPPGAAGILDR